MNDLLGLLTKVGVLSALAVVLGVPLAFRPAGSREPEGAARVIIITPHNDQIRHEFARGFDRWHRERFAQPAIVDWRQPGGTTEIRRLLVSQYTEAIRTGRITAEGALRDGAEPMPFDLLMGGGTFEHGEVKRGVKATPPGEDKDITMPISISMGYTTQQLDEWYGTRPEQAHKVGAMPLYDPGDEKRGDPGQFWLGKAVSGFGIIFNRDVLRQLELPEPTEWEDMCDPKLRGWIGLADPRQSGSVATTYESILNVKGWDEGWRILRRMSANARYFTNSALKVPLDVAHGQAAMGVAIDFYGRYQSQALMKPGETPETSRVGYVDPPGVVLIDPDPISMLRGGPNPQIARRFVEYVLSEEGQAVWNFPVRAGEDSMGPEKFELRRMPIRRVMFEKHWDSLIDRVDPYKLATDAPNKGWRSAIGPMMGAFAIDVHEDQVAAWEAIQRARSGGVSEELLANAEGLFDAFPAHTIPAQPAAEGKEAVPERTLAFNAENYRAIREDWRAAEKDGRMSRVRMGYTAFFRENYRDIVRTLRAGGGS